MKGNFFALDLDAKKSVPKVARAAGVTPGDVCWGLFELWEHVWLTRDAVVTLSVLAGCVGANPALHEALVAFGFLEPVEGSRYRVRGAEKYLRISEGRRKGGLAAKANLIPGGPKQDAAAETSAQVSRAPEKTDLGSSSAYPSADPRLTPGLDLGSTPNTQHPTPKETTYVRSEVTPTPRVITPPDTPPEGWSGEDFWRWCQGRRQASGLVAEKWPHPAKLGAWWSAATAVVPVQALQEGFYRYGDDKFWQAKAPPLPFMGFVSQWERFVPQTGGSHART
mgnify:CR=1 FL=1